MARCFVTVEGQTITVEAKSLYYACFAYNYEQVCGSHRTFPKLERETMITVQVEGEEVAHQTTWGAALDWSNRPRPQFDQ